MEALINLQKEKKKNHFYLSWQVNFLIGKTKELNESCEGNIS